MAENLSCSACREEFHLSDQDLRFYLKLKVPHPTHCPECREQRRTLQINQLKLFKRRCDATGEAIISNYSEDSPCTVYSQKHWYSDAFDGTQFGRAFDFSRPFFDQFQDLALEVPRPALFTDYLRDENSAYTNYAGLNKNCYLVFDSDENWDCYYSYGMNRSRSSLDCYRVQNLELCYQAVDSRGCYNCAYIYNCDSCHDSLMLRNCIGCKNCLMCSNLRHCEYHVFNRRVSKAEFEKLRQSFRSFFVLSERAREFESFALEFPQKYMRGFQNENVSGDHLVNCKNAIHCFDARDLWDGKYCFQVFMKVKDAMDCHEVGDAELLYECANLGYNAFNIRFSMNCLNQITNLTYCNYCFNGAADLFGCIGLKRKRFCILNKQYSEDDYRKMVEKIIEHMNRTGEWGEFFPAWTSSFPYNHTIAQESFPLRKKDAASKNLQWQDRETKEYRAVTVDLPDRVEDLPESFSAEILACACCGKNYKIIGHELDYLRQAALPLPRACFDCRHLNRLTSRPPRYLWLRTCSRCESEIESSFAPGRPEQVFCGKCYLDSLG